MENLQVSTTVTNVINNLNNAIKKSPNGVTFISIKNYTNSSGEISNNLINIGASYERAKQADIEFLKNLDITKIEGDPILLAQARTELINSFIKPNENISNGQINAYVNILPGLKVHIETGEIYIYGYRENKTIVQKGEYKEVKSKPLTIAKNILRKLLKTNKFTQYKISNIGKITANKETLEIG